MIPNLSLACAGAVLFGYVVIGLFFCRYWQRTGARLFSAFALAFFILALERAMMLTEAVEPVHEPIIYLTRLVAFLVIAWAIWDTNRARR
ncbi:MAG TPA: DUF5985 family protein [Lacunisphaera sp.]|nr:DUF5985 family protein [Lacunisphaera sp.]